LIEAAVEVADTAFTDQKIVVGTSLHRPIQALIDALSKVPEADVARQASYEAFMADLRRERATASAPDAETRFGIGR
jgi:hypothetical protein